MILAVSLATAIIRQIESLGYAVRTRRTGDGTEMFAVNLADPKQRHAVSNVRAPFMIRVRTPDEAVLSCLRGLSFYAEGRNESGDRNRGHQYTTWRETGRGNWEENGNEVVFKFTSLEALQQFEAEAKRLLDGWELVWRNPES